MRGSRSRTRRKKGKRKSQTDIEADYLNPSKPGSFRGKYLFSKTRDRKKVGQILQSLDAYTKHLPYRRKFPRSKTITSSPNVQHQVDLLDYQKLASYNDGYKYILVDVDVFSKKLFLRAVKTKGALSIVDAFKDLFKKWDKIVFSVQSDQGREFVNEPLQKLFKSRGIKHFYTKSDLKSSIAERTIRTIRNVIERYFTANNTKRYIDVLAQIEEGCNNTFHTSIGMTPNQVNERNAETVWLHLYGPKEMPKRPDLTPGTAVRISKVRGTFTKSSLANWTTEIFYIHEGISGNPPYYHLRDYGGEIIQGRFYRQELQPVMKKDDIYQVESILQTRVRRGRTEYLVRWLGYPNKFDSWVTSFV